MYLPAHFQHTDPAHLLEVMQAHSFATVIHQAEGHVVANHIPLLVTAPTEANGPWRLQGHCAANNPLAALPEGASILVVFQGPHAYVSPRAYAQRESVPTWNYIAVHMQGTLNWVRDSAEQEATMWALIAHYDAAYLPQYDSLSAEYKARMLGAIAAFEISANQVEGKFKLSQNKSPADRLGVYADQQHGSADEQALARWMARLGLVE
ncbi:FMN-binding negative transcriptional regulator [Parvibium lacunae]|uniref:FMN-binding negative transcriptional regulator n=1 Tax=Parvibium lacunae TaxID=1888893 RepID=A0A368L6Q9_9BURK|nr:FMN-binding negative transcriptional regulator [Parvibium lacunae]RCS59191.1 FMN-binding negative transcriptional regulator [Parvibium lacunae]